MRDYDVVVLTEDRYESPNDTSNYVRNIFLEDGLIREALEKLGLRVTRKSWSDPGFDWGSTKTALFRTTWDYFDRYDEFMSWAHQASSQTKFINSYELLKWNLDKHYLQDLKDQAIPVVETHFVEKGAKENLASLVERISTEEVVVKPAISGAGKHTYRIHRNNLSQYENIFQGLVRHEAMLVQPFLESVLSRGEVSLMIMDGQFTHAVRKIGKPGDFRVQDDFGGTVHEYVPTETEKSLAERVVAACPEFPVYARVDIVTGQSGDLLIGELELIEPELFFRNNPDSARILASAVLKKIEDG